MALKPDLIVSLKMIYNVRGHTGCSRRQLLIDVAGLPAWPGAYVLRYEQLHIDRHTSRSPILKIGEASMGIRNRFDNYNHQRSVTIDNRNAVDIMSERSQATNVRLMHYLSHSRLDDVLLECYQSNGSPTARQLEFALLKDYFILYNELPPLNFGFK